MSFKEKVKNFGKAILSIPIGLVIAIPFIISLPMIPIISIFDLISEFLVKSRQEKESTGQEKESTGEEKEFTASDALKEAFKQFQADSLPDYEVLKDNVQSSVPDLTSGEKERIARFGGCYSGNTDVQELIKSHQDKDEVTKKLLLGYIKLDDYASVQRLKNVLKNVLRARKEEAKEGSVVRDVVGRITIIPKMFLFLFLRALEAIGLSHVKLPKSETYKKEITAAFSLFKSKASMLLNRSTMENSRSTMEKELAKSLHGIVVDYITSSMTSLDVCDNVIFANRCKKITVEPEDYNEYEKINNKTVEKIAGIFRLLTDVKLGIRPSADKAFKKEFNHEVCNLLKCACFGDLNVSPGKMANEEIIPSAGGKFVQKIRATFSNFLDNLLQSNAMPDLSSKEGQKMANEEIIPSVVSTLVRKLQPSFSNFLDNLLQSKDISGLSKAQQADYINICCTKVLKAYIVYGSVYSSDCPAPRLPLSYMGHVDNIATHLSNDITKTLSLDELNTLYNMSPADLKDYINNFLLDGFFSKECIKAELIQPMDEIKSMISDFKRGKLETDIPANKNGTKIGTKGPQPTPSLSEASSSQDSAYVNNGLQV